MLIVYDEIGRITQALLNVCTEETVDLYKQNGHPRVFIYRKELPNIRDYFVIETDGVPEIVQRPLLDLVLSRASIIADGADAAVLTGVPAGASGTIDDGTSRSQFVGDGEPIEVQADHPGTYRVFVECWPYMSNSVAIEARA
ncbi:MAG TPA: hypothetical protein VNQ56_12820 [Pseudolabrys sp.]|nr:hypothetical protein [Pseudolabrys sp.]